MESKASFASIRYHVYRIADENLVENDMQGDLRIGSRPGVIHDIVALLHEWKYLACADQSHNLIWLFDHAEDEHLWISPHKIPELLSEQGFKLLGETAYSLTASIKLTETALSSGELLAADLAMYQLLRTSIARSPQSVPHSAQSALTTQAVSSRSTGPNGQHPRQGKQHSFQQEKETSRLYKFFISAVLGLISYHLAKTHSLVPLGCRTFLDLGPRRDESLNSMEKSASRYINVVSVNVYLTTSGTLVISSSAQPDAVLTNLDRMITLSDHTLQSGMLLRVAPSGMIAKFIATKTNKVRNDSNPPHRQTPKSVSGPRQTGSTWKRSVLEWLSAKGIHISRDGEGCRWALIRLTDKAVHLDGLAVDSENLECLWPASLCLIHESQDKYEHNKLGHAHGIDTTITTPTSRDGSYWFQTSSHSGYVDSLRSTQEWNLGKSHRASEREAQIQAQKVKDEGAATHLRHELAGIFAIDPPSPISSRAVPYMESTTAGGVYPTPPDVVVTHAFGTTATMDGMTTTLELVGNHFRHITSQSVEQATENMDTESSSLPDVILQGGQIAELEPFAIVRAAVGEDIDMIASMDEDDFGPIGITDADFNFFDEPDNADIDILLNAHELDSEAHLHDSGLLGNHGAFLDELGEENGSSQAYSMTVPSIAHIETLDAKSYSALGTHEASDGSAGVSPASADTTVEDAEHGRNTSQQHTIALRDPDIGSPLSPALIQHTLFSLSDCVDSTTRSCPCHGTTPCPVSSRFESLKFNPNLTLNDAKYRSDGRFAVPALQQVSFQGHKHLEAVQKTPKSSHYGHHRSDLPRKESKNLSRHSSLDSPRDPAGNPSDSDTHIEGDSDIAWSSPSSDNAEVSDDHLAVDCSSEGETRISTCRTSSCDQKSKEMTASRLLRDEPSSKALIDSDYLAVSTLGSSASTQVCVSYIFR